MKNLKNKGVTIHFSEEKYVKIESLANASDQTLSSYLKGLIFQKLSEGQNVVGNSTTN